MARFAPLARLPGRAFHDDCSGRARLRADGDAVPTPARPSSARSAPEHTLTLKP